MAKLIFSVALCTYNGEQFLPEQLESIGRQTRLPDELVVCDDQSQDRTVRIVQEFAQRVPFPVHLRINSSNLGSTKNFEQAIQLCQGDLIALSDQDDVWMPEKLEEFELYFERYPNCGYVFSDMRLTDEGGQWLGNQTAWEASKFRSEQFGAIDAYDQLKILLKYEKVTGAAMAFRSSLKPLVLPISPLWIHDGWISLLAQATGFPGIPIAKPLITYRLHPAQQTAVGRESLFARYRRSRTVRGEFYRRQAQRFIDAKDRLNSQAGIPPGQLQPSITLLEQKAEHLLARAAIHSTGYPARLKIVLAEFLAGRYHQFSDTWNCLIKDTLL